MKTTTHSRDDSLQKLTQALAQTKSADAIGKLLSDLCTPAELEALADRWAVALALQTGASYRTINAQTGVSLTTITRVARYLKQKDSGYSLAIDKL
jgi:TrpR-related protein YerC/YecD